MNTKTTIQLPVGNAARQATEISLTYSDGTAKLATVCRLTKIIAYKGKYFLRCEEIGFTHYEQVSGEDLSNIEVAGS